MRATNRTDEGMTFGSKKELERKEANRRKLFNAPERTFEQVAGEYSRRHPEDSLTAKQANYIHDRAIEKLRAALEEGGEL